MKTQLNLAQLRRLNELWLEAEDAAEKAEYTKWNECLDRIYINLFYNISKYPRELIKKLKKNKKMADIFILDESSEPIWKDLTKQILKAKRELKKKDCYMSRTRLYRAVMVKDIWLRKLQRKRGLYLEEE